MKKRAFLVPLAASVAALLGAADASATAVQPQVVKPAIDSVAIGNRATPDEAFVLTRSMEASPEFAAHYSHRSHASHVSHVSHRSHYSHVSGS